MEVADVASEAGLDEWDKANLSNINTNGKITKCWADRHSVLVDWINRLPET